MRRKRVGYVPIIFGAAKVGFGAIAAQNSLYSSSNWSGYFASVPSGDAFSDISSTWVIPALKAPSSGTTYSADWVGFDGVTDSTVEQCGTLSDITSHGRTTYYAWYEFYPANSVEITSLTVHPGDTINAEVIYEAAQSTTGNYAYYFDVSDQTTGKSFTDTLFTSSNDARSSAEWIDEAPTVGNRQSTLANFGSVAFSNDVAALDGGSDEALGTLSYNNIEMVQNNAVVATPTLVNSGGEAFTIDYGSGPPNLTWNNTGGASPSDGKTWDINDNNNWNNGAAATVYTDGSNLTFNDDNNGHYAVALNSTVNPGSVTVNNSSGNYTISGAGSIAGAGALGKSGSGTLILSNTGINTYSGGTTVSAGTLLIGAAGALPAAGNVAITGGALQLGASTGVETLSSLSISGSGAFDVNNNHIILSYTGSQATADATIRGYLISGYAGGAWNGPGINSSAAAANSDYAVGYADGADGIVTGLSSGQIEVEYTLYGDANLDGMVNGTDFGIFAANFGKEVSAWDQGDFNYDGLVNGSDFGLLAANLGRQASGAAIALPAGDWTALDSFAAANGLLVDVPEPASLGLILLAGLGILSRRRRPLEPRHLF
jgi:autotransporter-associated beta strand protein